MSDSIREKAIKAAEHFLFQGTVCECERYGNDHINDTFRIQCRDEKGSYPYILQRINRNVFQDPAGLMNNINHVTKFLREKIVRQGGDPIGANLRKNI